MEFEYIVKLSVTDNWIEDGFDGDPDRIYDVLKANLLPYAYGHEVQVQVKKVEVSK